MVRKVRSLMVRCGYDSIAPSGDHLIGLFKSYISLLEVNEALGKVSKPSVFTWNAIISAHSKVGHGIQALACYDKMQQEGIQPDKVTFLCVCKACSSIGALGQGRLVQYQIVRSGLEVDIVIANTLVDMYAKCGSLEEARDVFDEIPNRDVVSWTVMISGYAAHGHGLCAIELYKKMHQDGIKANRIVILCTLKACSSIGSIWQGRQIHEEVLEAKLESDLPVMSSLVDMYAKCGGLEEAREVFDRLPIRDVVSWSAMISGFAQHGYGFVALELFENMQREGTKPNKVTFLGILKACGSINATDHGRSIHGQVTKRGLETDVVIGSALVDMYAKCGSLEEAQKVFQRLADRNVVSWGAIISGFAQQGHALSAFKLFYEMQEEGIQPNRVIYLSVLKACGSMGALNEGSQVHDQLLRTALESDLSIGNTLVDMYAKCGSLEAARKVFDGLSNRDAVSWGAMISGYSQQGHGELALGFFEKMQQNSIKPDRATFLCILKACVSIGAIGYGKRMHELIISDGLESDFVVKNTLVEMYAKNGSLEDALKVFAQISNQDVISCGAMIAGSAQCGNFWLVTQTLEDMGLKGLKPDDVMFTSILTACSHAGLWEEGHRYFKSMRDDHGLIPNMEHYSCMVDLLGRAGHLNAADDVLQTMPMPPDVVMLTSFLSSCRTYSNAELGEQCFAELLHLDPIDSSGYMLMSNMYADCHNWNEVKKIQELRKCTSAWNKPGRACIEVNKEIQEFIVADNPHNEWLQTKIMRLSRSVKRQGFIPLLELVWQQMPG